MAIELRLLGDVEALVDGQRLDIGHARQRCVLVALLVDLNHSVPTDQLIHRVWADDPPHRVRNALAGYLSRLRMALADSGEVAIVRERGGYVLKGDPSSVDLHLFRRLVSGARASTEPGRAADLFDDALAMWRGEPFSTLDTPWVNDVRTSLEAERLSVALDRNDAALKAGRHRDLLGGIHAAALAHPLDERLAAQLMVAQYRSGRQADALETYRQMRDRLVDELGVDPSPTLRSAYQLILDGDDDAPAAVPDRGSLHQQPVASLPRRATSFVGREQELATVAETLAQGPLVTLTGVGGAGKTRLALEAAGLQQSLYRDGVWLCELAALDDDAAVGHALAGALRLQQRHGLDITATVIEYLVSRQLLIVLDNCEHVLDAAADLVAQIVARCAEVTVLATSREALGVDGERILAVPPLALDEATTLFADRARACRPEFDLDREPVGTVAEICRQLDGLPLAIELAAARIRVMSSLDLARRLDGLRLISGGVRGALPRQQSLAATIDWSYRMLSAPEQALFACLSVFAGGFDLAAAHGVCGDKTGDGEVGTLELLTGLVEKSMIVVRAGTGTTRYRVLETLRAYGRDRLCDNSVDGVYAGLHAVYFTELAENAAAGMHTPDEGVWVERMLPDFDNLRVAFERAMADDDVDLALRLVTSLSEFVHLRVGYESSEWAERALARTDPDHPLYAAAVGFAARGAWNRGDDRVRSLAALAGGRVPDRGNGRVAYPGDVLADVALYEGHPDVALAHYSAERERARRDGDRIRLVWTLFYVAICHAALRSPVDGLAAAQEAMAVAEKTANPTARSMAGYSLGLVLKKSEPQKALALFDEAAESAASVQNFWWQGIAMMEAAATRGVHGDTARAASDFLAVLDHWDRVGDWSQQWLNLRYVTRLLMRLDEDEEARTLHHALLKAGKQSPLSGSDVSVDAGAGADALDGVGAVARARSVLSRYC